MGKYIVNVFHIGIVTSFLLVFIGCGYKSAPTYLDDNIDNNSSIEKRK